MQLIIVNNEQTARQFLEVHIALNKNVPGWIRPLDKDINQVFDPKKNKAFRHGTCIRWILKDDKGNLIGRIAAFVNKKYRSKDDPGAIGGVGFFDCINDQAAANLLLSTAQKWLDERGMTAMDGPINFGERDKWWGLVTQGYQAPLYCMNYNPPYYVELFTKYGFQPFFNQICFGMHPKERLQDKFFDRHAALAADPNFSARHIRKSALKKYASDFCTVYNKAWAGHAGNKELSVQQCIKLFEQMKPVMDERINWFVYYEGEPIATWINLPDLNQWFKYLNGKFSLWHKLKFLWLKKTRKNSKFVGLVFGIVPEFQGRGVDAYIIIEGCRLIQNMKIENGNYEIGELLYEDYEMQWIGEFNPKMINVAENLGTYRSRILTTYRYNFDRTKEFKPHPILH